MITQVVVWVKTKNDDNKMLERLRSVLHPPERAKPPTPAPPIPSSPRPPPPRGPSPAAEKAQKEAEMAKQMVAKLQKELAQMLHDQQGDKKLQAAYEEGLGAKKGM